MHAIPGVDTGKPGKPIAPAPTAKPVLPVPAAPPVPKP
jgi:hypothetical protein